MTLRYCEVSANAQRNFTDAAEMISCALELLSGHSGSELSKQDINATTLTNVGSLFSWKQDASTLQATTKSIILYGNLQCCQFSFISAYLIRILASSSKLQ